jgi:hypothetical protein
MVADTSVHWSAGSISLGLRQNIMAAGQCDKGCSPHDSQEAECNRKRPGQDILFNNTPSVTYHLPILSSEFEPINESIHWLGQSPWDPITSPKDLPLNIACIRTKPSIYEPFWRTFHIQTIAVYLWEGAAVSSSIKGVQCGHFATKWPDGLPEKQWQVGLWLVCGTFRDHGSWNNLAEWELMLLVPCTSIPAAGTTL